MMSRGRLMCQLAEQKSTISKSVIEGDSKNDEIPVISQKIVKASSNRLEDDSKNKPIIQTKLSEEIFKDTGKLSHKFQEA